MEIDFLMRSLMFVPAHNEKLILSAAKTKADVLLLDIEDSVQPANNKQIARDNIIKYVNNGIFQNCPIFPRVNDRESGHLLQDIYQLTIKGISGFMYPKAKKGEDIYFFGKLLETIEYEKGFPINTFKIIPLIETTSALINIQDICSICTNRVIAVAFGCEDFISDLGGENDEKGISIFTPRTIITAAAKANGIIPIDTVHIKVHDLDDLEKNLILSKKLGFEGMLSLNPKEINLIHQYYSPSEEDIIWATEMLELSKEAFLQGKGVTVKDNKFIGPPFVSKAKKIIKKYQMIKAKEI
jgi:citrate lyase subunit beta/citryl-CoA lyase